MLLAGNQIDRHTAFRVSTIFRCCGIFYVRVVVCRMPSRRLEDKIRELCARVVSERGPEWWGTVSDLRAALEEHTLKVNNRAATATVANRLTLIPERRGT